MPWPGKRESTATPPRTLFSPRNPARFAIGSERPRRENVAPRHLLLQRCECCSSAVWLILNAEGHREAVWIFRIGGTLTTASDAAVLVIGNGYDGNVFWSAGQVTLGEDTRFIGNLFAHSDIALREGASLSGRAFARTGSVTLHANEVSLCCAPLQLAPGTLPDGALGTPYHQVFSAAAACGRYVTISSVRFRSGWSSCAMDAAGTLAGTPESSARSSSHITARMRGTARAAPRTASASIAESGRRFLPRRWASPTRFR